MWKTCPGWQVSLPRSDPSKLDNSHTNQVYKLSIPAENKPPVIPRTERATESAAVKLIPKLVEAARWSQAERIAELTEQIAEIVDARHPAVAKALRKNCLAPKPIVAMPKDILDMREPRHGFDTVVVPTAIAEECRSIVDEHARREDLARFHLEPRHKVLLYGPPGNGKTMLAEAMAFELQVPFLVVRYGGLIESFLGATGRNLEKAMAYAATNPCVLFMDEFDGIGMDRSRMGDVGELRRVTNHLLIEIERLPSHVILICATNALDLVDGALRRRFDFPIELPAPTEVLRLRCAERELDPSITGGHDLRSLAPKVAMHAPTNLSDVVQLCRRLRREVALHGADQLTTTELWTRLSLATSESTSVG